MPCGGAMFGGGGRIPLAPGGMFGGAYPCIMPTGGRPMFGTGPGPLIGAGPRMGGGMPGPPAMPTPRPGPARPGGG